MMKRMLSSLLIMCLLVCLLPRCVLAAPDDGMIKSIEIYGVTPPQPGELARSIYSDDLTLPDNAGYKLVKQQIIWHDWRDWSIVGDKYCFEPGMTYSITVSLSSKVGYGFAEGLTATLADIPKDRYTSKVEIAGGNALVTFTFTLPGEAEYRTLDAFYFYGPPIKEGMKYASLISGTYYAYDRFHTLSPSLDGKFDPANRFIGGETYRFSYLLTIDDGFSVAPDEQLSIYWNDEPIALAYTNRITNSHGDFTVGLFFDYTVEQTNWIESALVKNLKQPFAGGTAPAYTVDYLSTEKSAPYYVTDTERTWRRPDGSFMEEGEQFEAGKQYSITLGIGVRSEAFPQYKFNEDSKVSLHGWEKEDYTVKVKSVSDSWIGVTISCVCQEPPPTDIEQINLTDLDVPVPGDVIDVFCVPGEPGYTVTQLSWYDDNTKTYLGGVNSTFTQGHVYNVTVELAAQDGFAFGDFYDTTAYINGQKASILQITDDTARIMYEFPVCDYVAITEIYITELDAPQADHPGDYDAQTGRHYYLDKNDHNYFEFGVGWYDLTTNEYLPLRAPFVSGHRYQAELYLKPSIGYVFDQPAVYVNGALQTEVYSGAQQTVVYVQFPGCYGPGESTIGAFELSIPNRAVAGQSAPYGVTVTPATCTFEQINTSTVKNGVCWYDQTLKQEVQIGDVLQKGHSYQVIVYLRTVDGCYFSSTLAAFYGGKEVAHLAASNTQATVVIDYGVLGESASPFTDVAQNSYCYEPVLWAVEKGITSGISPTLFGPNDSCTRGQAVTFLWRSVGSPDPGNVSCPFTDVSETAFYYKAMLWAVQKGITKGTSDTTFSPNDPCTRGQIVTFLWRTMKEPAASAKNDFKDVSETAFYYDAVLWAVQENITKGTGEGKFSPGDFCTRGQIVTFLYRCLTN